MQIHLKMNRRLAVICLLLGICHGYAMAQIPLVPFEGVPVTKQGAGLQNAWAGGLNSPQFSMIDLNGDAVDDLVAFERDFYGSVKTFLGSGTIGLAEYDYAPYYRVLFPPMRNWMLLRDYDCDGREDIFTSVPGGVAVYRNHAGAAEVPVFEKVSSILYTEGIEGTVPLYVSPPDIPAISDIDGDGDLDILSFNVIGSTLEYHKNMSVENYGDCRALEFELKNACWGYFSEDGNNNTVTLYDTCELNVSDPESIQLHAGSTVLALDLNGSGAMDLLLGDITYNNLVRLTNGGTPESAIMTDQGTSFPENSLPVDITVFPAPFLLDLDNDGLKDLLVSPNNPNTSENFNNIWYYHNEGSAEIPLFSYVSNDFLQDGMIDLGERSVVAFFDENADGLTDIIAGSFGYFVEAGIYDSRLMLLRNNGTVDDPSYELADSDYAGLGVYGFNGVYPAFGDIDGDGDGDMFIGDEDGHVHYFNNEGGQGNPASFVLTGPNYAAIDVGQSARPRIFDLDRDGLNDLVIGERSGTVRYYRNTGTLQQAVFSSAPTVEELGGIDVMKQCCTGYSAPCLSSDSLGQTIMYVGSEQGWLYLYDNIDGNVYGTFNLVDSLYLNGVNVNIDGADINNDGSPEFVSGEEAGGLGLLTYGNPPVYGIADKSPERLQLRVFPNPAKGDLTVEVSAPGSVNEVEFALANTIGMVLQSGTRRLTDKILDLDLSGLPAGVYFLRITIVDRSSSVKVIRW